MDPTSNTNGENGSAWSVEGSSSFNQVPGLPFCVHRSSRGELPVYSEYKDRKARVLTLVRRVSGDMNQFESEGRDVVGFL